MIQTVSTPKVRASEGNKAGNKVYSGHIAQHARESHMSSVPIFKQVLLLAPPRHPLPVLLHIQKISMGCGSCLGIRAFTAHLSAVELRTPLG